MLRKAYFMGDVLEQTYKKGYHTGLSNDWYSGEEYNGVYTSLGYWEDNERRYERLVRRETFHIEVTEIEWEKGWKIRIDKEIVKIKDVIHRLDGSIEYHTDKTISMTTIV